MPTDRLKIGGKELRGTKLWEEFRKQTNLKPGDPKEKEDGSIAEVFSTERLVQIFKAFRQWRENIGRSNQAVGKKNLKRDLTKESGYGSETSELSLEAGSPFTRRPRSER